MRKLIGLRTSSHVDAGIIRGLIERLNPDEILPVHTENAAWFETL